MKDVTFSLLWLENTGIQIFSLHKNGQKDDDPILIGIIIHY